MSKLLLTGLACSLLLNVGLYRYSQREAYNAFENGSSWEAALTHYCALSKDVEECVEALYGTDEEDEIVMKTYKWVKRPPEYNALFIPKLFSQEYWVL